MESAIKHFGQSDTEKPLVIDLFCGLGGWSQAFLDTGFRAIGFDIEAHDYGSGGYPGELVLKDIRSLNGADLVKQYGVPACIVASPPCFPAEALILAKRGLIPISEIKIGDEVLTHTNRWQRVKSVMSRVGDTLISKGQGGPLEATAEHPIYVRKMGVWKSFWNKLTKKPNNIKMPDSEPHWLPFAKIVGSHWATPNAIPGLPIPPIPHGIGSNPDFWWMVGRWLGDGWTRKRGNSGSIIICCAHREREELHSRLEKIAPIDPSKKRRNKTGELNWSCSRQKTTWRFETGSRALVDWFELNFNKFAHRKTVPTWVFGMPEAWRSAILAGYLSSDGHVRLNGKNVENHACTASKALCLGVRLLAESLGHTTSIYFTKRPKTCVIEGRVVNQRDTWSVVWQNRATRHVPADHRDATLTWGLVRYVAVGRNGIPVFNIEVEEDNSYIADGRVVHNCQEFSYMAMPWSKAKDKMRRILANPAEQKRLTDLFNQCFRIQREVSEAAGHYVPMVVENVRGACKWVGKSKWNFGSFHLWGDVPALMPIPAKKLLKIAGQQSEGGKEMKISMTYAELKEGCKNFTPGGIPLEKNTLARRHGSKSKARKQASAEIAKIPPALAGWIARTFKPETPLQAMRG